MESMNVSVECGLTVHPPDPLVAVVAGGDTAEWKASVASGYNVFNSLSSRFACVLLTLRRGEWSVLEHQMGANFRSSPRMDHSLQLVDATTGERIRPNVAVLCTHGFPGETGELQGLLSIAGIPYCSSGVFASALAAEKFRCSQYLAAVCGLRIPRQRRLTSAQLTDAMEQEFEPWLPFVLKPASLGSSLGVLSVHDRRGISVALNQAATWRCDFVVQEFVDGQEITVGAIRLRDKLVVLPPASVIRSSAVSDLGIGTYSDHKAVQLRIPANVPSGALTQIDEDMRCVGEALGLLGFFRADFVWSEGTLHFLEINTIPGLSETSVFPQLAEAGGYDLGAALEALITDALECIPPDTGGRPAQARLVSPPDRRHTLVAKKIGSVDSP